MNVQGSASTTGYTNTAARTGSGDRATTSVSFSDILRGVTDTEQVDNRSTSVTKEARWQQIASKYDVTHISSRERGTLTGELLGHNLISTREGLALAAPLSMNENLDTRRDYLAISHEALAFSKQNGSSPQQLAQQQQVVNILERLFAFSDASGDG